MRAWGVLVRMRFLVFVYSESGEVDVRDGNWRGFEILCCLCWIGSMNERFLGCDLRSSTTRATALVVFNLSNRLYSRPNKSVRAS